MSVRNTLVTAFLLFSPLPLVSATTITDLASSFNLTASESLLFPAVALDSNTTVAWIKRNWQLNGDRVQFGQADLTFTDDPATDSSLAKRQSQSSSSRRSSRTSSSSIAVPTATGAAVLSVDYPKDSYSHSTGGAQFFSQPLNVSNVAPETYTTMLLSYDIYFPADFQYNKGGKLPGLRGGPDPRGCSGGSQTDGTGCFSTRLMWRTGRQGEVYAYIPTTTPNFCSETNIICNSDYGTSLARGSFSFQSGQWQNIMMVVQLNQIGTANGVLELYYNGVQAMTFSNLEFRSSESLASVGGMYFSTFFGGDDSSWATPTDQHTYYRNIQVMGGTSVASGSGKKTSDARQQAAASASFLALFTGVFTLYMAL